MDYFFNFDKMRYLTGAKPEGCIGADGVFVASEVLAKHDENYMPPEAQHAVDQAQKTGQTLKQ